MASTWFTPLLHGASSILLLSAFSNFASTWNAAFNQANIQAVFFRAWRVCGKQAHASQCSTTIAG